jgi:SAM-dependent methyltransferase
MDRLGIANRGFGRAAEVYDRGRPGYPAEAIAALTEALRLGPGVRVVDVGAGTGKLTALLVPTGADVVAVEPVAAMRERLKLPGVRVLEGTAERLPLADASVDAVVCGQAFHWFDSDAALAEFARALVPGGGVGLIWNIRDEDVPWAAELTAVIDAYEGDAPRYRKMEWRRAFRGPLEARSVRHVHRLPVPAMCDRFASISFIAALDDEERSRVLDRIEAILRRVADAEGNVSMPYRTDVFWTDVVG